MTCPELLDIRWLSFSNPGKKEEELRQRFPIDLENYTRLGQGHGIIMRWFERSAEMKDCRGAQCFDAFFSLWSAFNGWASCVSDIDVDSQYIIALMVDQGICETFKKFVAASNPDIQAQVFQFAACWPIIEVKSLRKVEPLKQRLKTMTVEQLISSLGGKEELIRQYPEVKFEPKCWKRHIKPNQQAPIDWPHTLSALYKFRCNLFHGAKELTSEGEQILASSAYHTLLSFLEYAGYLHW